MSSMGLESSLCSKHQDAACWTFRASSARAAWAAGTGSCSTCGVGMLGCCAMHAGNRTCSQLRGHRGAPHPQTPHCMSARMCKTTGTRQVSDFSISAARSCAALHAWPRSVVGPYAGLNSPPGAHGKQATMCCQSCASCCAAATLLPEQQSQLCSKTTREAINQHMCQQHVSLRQPVQRSAHCAAVQHAWHCPAGPQQPAQQLRMPCV